MTFLIRPGAPLQRAELQARALDTWREAELLVQDLTPRPQPPATSPTGTLTSPKRPE
jgi:hypothetical protein